jgi:hypothetical protein
VIGSYNYDEYGIDDALALLAGGKLPTGVLIEPDDVDLEGLGSAMARLAAGEVGGKLLVVPGSPPSAGDPPATAGGRA